MKRSATVVESERGWDVVGDDGSILATFPTNAAAWRYVDRQSGVSRGEAVSASAPRDKLRRERWKQQREPTMTDTVPHTMVNAVTGEHHVIQLRPKEGMTAADAQAFRAERIEEGKRIDPETCDIIKYKVQAVDLYGIFEVPDELWCVGSELFARNLPDGYWVWFGDLPEERCKALFARI